MRYVYILQCVDKGYYVGSTDDLRDRMRRHTDGRVPATKYRLPAALIAYLGFSDSYAAYNFEKYLKTGSGRAFAKRHFGSSSNTHRSAVRIH